MIDRGATLPTIKAISIPENKQDQVLFHYLANKRFCRPRLRSSRHPDIRIVIQPGIGRIFKIFTVAQNRAHDLVVGVFADQPQSHVGHHRRTVQVRAKEIAAASEIFQLEICVVKSTKTSGAVLFHDQLDL